MMEREYLESDVLGYEKFGSIVQDSAEGLIQDGVVYTNYKDEEYKEGDMRVVILETYPGEDIETTFIERLSIFEVNGEKFSFEWISINNE